ncbi:hypothetical protein GCM10011504_25110 [Siccirubricoccus deserti]|nr:hypothetical protein GCM10011504_25110 [Siccirubricoccus deserti]
MAERFAAVACCFQSGIALRGVHPLERCGPALAYPQHVQRDPGPACPESAGHAPDDAARGGWLGLICRATTLILALAGVGAAVAQPAATPPPATSRDMPPEAGRARPGTPPDAAGSRAGSGPTGEDIIDRSQTGGRGLMRPPPGGDSAVHGGVPDPVPRSTPVIPRPATPGSEPGAIPR